jgi:hypothetical protein
VIATAAIAVAAAFAKIMESYLDKYVVKYPKQPSTVVKAVIKVPKISFHTSPPISAASGC